MREPNEYWICIIGPTKRSEHPRNGEGPLRMAIRDAFYKVFGRDAKEYSSGFGLSEKEKAAIERLQAKQFQERIKTNSTIGR